MILILQEYIFKYIFIFLTKTTAAQSEDALSYDRMRGLYFLAVVFEASIVEVGLQKAIFIDVMY